MCSLSFFLSSTCSFSKRNREHLAWPDPPEKETCVWGSSWKAGPRCLRRVPNTCTVIKGERTFPLCFCFKGTSSYHGIFLLSWYPRHGHILFVSRAWAPRAAVLGSTGVLWLAWPWGAHPRWLRVVRAEEDRGPPLTSTHAGELQALSDRAAGADWAGKCVSVQQPAIRRAQFSGRACLLGIWALKISEI